MYSVNVACSAHRSSRARFQGSANPEAARSRNHDRNSHALFRARKIEKSRIMTARAASPEPVVAVDGDVVTLHYDCTDADGQVVDSSREREEPLSLELGVSEIVSNPLLSAMEEAVRSRGVGDIIELSLKGKEYDRQLVFTVPIDHPEIVRLQGRYKAQGGLFEDKIVELQNGTWAKVLRVSENDVVLDANPMLAGVERRLSIEILSIERPALATTS